MFWFVTLFSQCFLFLHVLATGRSIYFRLKANAPNLEDAGPYMSPNSIPQDPMGGQALWDLHKIATIKPLSVTQPFLKQTGANSPAMADMEGFKKHRLHLYRKIDIDSFGDKTAENIIELLKKNPLVEDAIQEPVAVSASIIDWNYNKLQEEKSFLRSASANKTLEQRFTADERNLNSLTSSIPDFSDCVHNRECQRYLLGPNGLPSYNLGGVNALEAHRLTNNKGENARIMMMEINHWDWDHIDLPRPEPELLLNHDHVDYHATCSAGSMFALDNGFGVLGIAAKAKTGYVEWSIDALIDLRNHLTAGDVIQVGIHYRTEGPHCEQPNVGKCYLPVEYLDAVKDAIRYLTEQKGVHVIIAAANGNINLDDPLYEERYQRSTDTGAIYAGAADPAAGSRAYFSEYGSRVDLFSWGMHVTTTTWKQGERDQYNHYYSGTSSANPIIAGCTAFLQSVARAKGIGNIPPKQLRKIMFDSGIELMNVDPERNIGRQPDLVKAVEILESMAPKTTETPLDDEKLTDSTETKLKSNIAIIGAFSGASLLLGASAAFAVYKLKKVKDPKLPALEGSFEGDIDFIDRETSI